MRNIVIPLAGLGKRFSDAGFKTPKPLIPVIFNGEKIPMIKLAIDSTNVEGRYIFICQKSQNLKDHLLSFKKNSVVIEIDYVTEGAAQTILLAKEYINNDDELVTNNCDQYLKWDANKFLTFIQHSNCDGCVVTQNANNPAYSYIQIENDVAVRLAEKEVISNNALIGLHYWRKGSDFVSSAESMINKNIRSKNEYYVSITYNELIAQGKKIIHYPLSEGEKFHPLGVPEDIFKFQGSGIQKYNINNFFRGWFIGNFEPSIHKQELFEVGYLTHKKGEVWPVHYHHIATEFNLLIEGEMIINGEFIKQGDIFVFPTDVYSYPQFLTDCKVICIKTPSIPDDKILI